MPEIRLLVREPGQTERQITLFPGATIGRAQGNGLTLADPAASRAHLRLLCENNRWFVEDTGSASGTVVDGSKTLKKGERAPLKHGTQLDAGDTVMVVSLEAETMDGTIPGKGGAPAPAASKPDSEINRTIPAPLAFTPRKAPAGADGKQRERPPAAVPPTPPAAASDATMRVPPSAPASPPAPKRPASPPTPPPPVSVTPSAAPPAQPAPAPASNPANLGDVTRRIETSEHVGLVLRPKLLARNARLILVGASIRRSVAIEDSPFIIGRADRSAVMLADNSISNEHAQVVFDHEVGFQLADLGSRNGTFVGVDRLAANSPRVVSLPAWVRFGAVEGWLVDDDSSSTKQERADRAACDALVRSGRLNAGEKSQAVEAARTGRRHISELVLLQTRLTVAEWADAAQRTGTGGNNQAKWWLVALAIAAVGGIAFWLIWSR